VRPARGAGLLLLGALALALVVFAAHRNRPRSLQPLRIWGGSLVTSRALFAEALAAATGGEVDSGPDALRALDEVDAGRLDSALVPGALPLDHHPRLRQVAVLQLEPLHLLVSGTLAPAVSARFDALRGKVVNIGPSGRTEHRLARAVLEFIGVPARDDANPDGYVPSLLDPRELLADADGAVALPDAVFLIETLPSPVARALIVERGYRLVALPFAEAFALSALRTELEARAGGAEHETGEPLRRGFVYEAVIPAFTYSVDPAVPAQPLRTLATRLLFIANENVPSGSIERTLEVAYSASFGGVMNPPLDRSLLKLAPELPRHRGTEAFLRRHEPALTASTIDAAANTLSVGGALLGSGLFLWQLWRQRSRHRRQETFEAYLVKVAAIEQRATELEVAAVLDLESLIALQREVARLKSEALERFSAGELEGRELISGFLTHVNDVRDSLARLILHVRQLLEQQAEAEGRSAGAVWKEEAGPSDDGGPERA